MRHQLNQDCHILSRVTTRTPWFICLIVGVCIASNCIILLQVRLIKSAGDLTQHPQTWDSSLVSLTHKKQTQLCLCQACRLLKGYFILADNKGLLCNVDVMYNWQDLYWPQTNSFIFYPYCREGCIVSRKWRSATLHKQVIKSILAPWVVYYPCPCTRKERITFIWGNTLLSLLLFRCCNR